MYGTFSFNILLRYSYPFAVLLLFLTTWITAIQFQPGRGPAFATPVCMASSDSDTGETGSCKSGQWSLDTKNSGSIFNQERS